jgi:uncharacterized protein (TIGR00730 family)
VKSIAVFCGANKGTNPVFEQQAALLGKTLAERNIRLLYGGGSVGLMGVLADAVLAHGGPITGVITQYLLDKEVEHKGVTDMIVVESMAERRTMLIRGTDGVITMPGGYGSMDEHFEALTLAQLHQYHKPIGLLNVAGFYNPLLQMMDTMVDNGFLRAQNRKLCIDADNIDELLTRMADYEYDPIGKWM